MSYLIFIFIMLILSMLILHFQNIYLTLKFDNYRESFKYLNIVFEILRVIIFNGYSNESFIKIYPYQKNKNGYTYKQCRYILKMYDKHKYDIEAWGFATNDIQLNFMINQYLIDALVNLAKLNHPNIYKGKKLIEKY